VEADDDGLYVLKFRGAGQGSLALVAELISGEIGRTLGLRVPELVFMELDERIGKNEPDPEIRALLIASTGLNLGLDYLPGATMFDPAAGDKAGAKTASEAVWFDGFITNIDRTPKNANLLWWHKQLYFIDHGASLYFHHNWHDPVAVAAKPFPAIKDHILLPWASQIAQVDGELRSKLDRQALERVVAQVPPEWLEAHDGPTREGYIEYLTTRLRDSRFAEEAARAHAERI
jgi:hypothetical protein